MGNILFLIHGRRISVIAAIRHVSGQGRRPGSARRWKAIVHKAYGAEYIRNILYQENTPKKQHPPVKLKNEGLNNLRLAEPSLSDYDAYILKKETQP